MRYVIAVAAVLVAGSAWADTMFPDIDVDAQCQSDMRGVTNPQSLNYGINNCVDQQQVYYERLRIEWPAISDAHRIYCVTTSGKDPKFFRYSIIEPCVRAMIEREKYEGGTRHSFQQ